ncbi:MAG: hypothetical protein ABSG69_06195 [Candidatus Acidiferrum sp.]|jgi:hypothetical protein
MPSEIQIEKRLQIAGTLLIVGLLIEALCMLWKSPLAFILFAAIGGLLLGVGVVVYLVSLVSSTRHPG